MIVLVTGASSGLGAALQGFLRALGWCHPFQRAASAANIANPAVSVRKMRGPKWIAMNPRFMAACPSASSSPLSGPTRIVTGSAGEVKGNDSKPQDAAGESRKRVDTQGLDAVASGGVNVS